MTASDTRSPVVILLAEDDPGDQVITRRALAEGRMLHELHIVNDGEEALNYLYRRGAYADPASSPRPDLILLDLNMPKVDGRTCLETLQQDPDLQSIPVVVLTTSDRPDDIASARALGVRSYVTKPSTMEEFAKVVRRIEEDIFAAPALTSPPGPSSPAPAAPSGATAPNARSNKSTERLTVLVIDDDPGDIEILRRMLADMPEWNAELTACHDAEQGKAQLTAATADITFIDYQLGGHTGLELLQAARGCGHAGGIILLTGRGGERVAADALRAGSDDYLIKDELSPAVLRDTIQRVLAMRRAESEREQSARLALEDPLLHIGNRRAFDQAIRRVHSLAARHGRTYTIVMADVDSFKQYNDRFGHPAGDRVLVAIAEALRHACRDSDEVFRYGGEEFVLLLAEASPAHLLATCDRFRGRIEDLRIEHPDSVAGSVTASFGAAVYTPTWDGPDRQTLLARADEALYAAKQQGRNRCVVWQADGV